jgi:hypothetical protein
MLESYITLGWKGLLGSSLLGPFKKLTIVNMTPGTVLSVFLAYEWAQ